MQTYPLINFANFSFDKLVAMFDISLYFQAQVNDIYRIKPTI